MRALSDSIGAITDTYDYTASGEIFARTGATENLFLFAGQQFDSLTGQYYLRARFYQPDLGRFLSRDPMELQTFNPVELNRYVYAANNPVNLIDPSGRQSLTEYALQLVATPRRAAIVAGLAGIITMVALQRVREAVGVPYITWPEMPYFSPDGTDPDKKPEPTSTTRTGTCNPRLIRWVRRLASPTMLLAIARA